jgi:hypothetical protein
MEPFERHVDEQLRVRVTCLDGNDQRQSVAGVGNLSCSIFKQNAALTPVVSNDAAHCVIEETVAGTEGDVMYDAPPGTIAERGRYWMVFRCTIGGVLVSFPQQGYIPLIII